MNSMAKAFNALVDKSLADYGWQPGDYSSEDGLLMCGKCHTPKQRMVKRPEIAGGGMVTVGERCKCAQDEYEKEQKKAAHEKFLGELEERTGHLVDKPKREHTFKNDDGANPITTDTCKRYIEKWPEMLENNIGILLWGDVGTGKSFMAGCVANALIDKDVMAGVTSLPQILALMQTARDEERDGMVRNLKWFDLLVIDDLGAERDTSFSIEQIYRVIDARAQSGKPVVVTTNLSLEELQSQINMDYRRIYDRILGMCPIRMKMTGKSRRAEEAQKRRIKALESLGYKEPT